MIIMRDLRKLSKNKLDLEVFSLPIEWEQVSNDVYEGSSQIKNLQLFFKRKNNAKEYADVDYCQLDLRISFRLTASGDGFSYERLFDDVVFQFIDIENLKVFNEEEEKIEWEETFLKDLEKAIEVGLSIELP